MNTIYIRERTPIVKVGEADILDIEEEIDGESEQDDGLSEPVMYTKEYYYMALFDFLKSQMTDCKYFLHGTRTNQTESFHNVSNLYCPKGTII